MTAYVLIGAGCLMAAGLVFALVRLAMRLGEKSAEKIIAEHTSEAIENAAKMRTDAEAAVRRAGDGTAGGMLGEWYRD